MLLRQTTNLLALLGAGLLFGCAVKTPSNRATGEVDSSTADAANPSDAASSSAADAATCSTASITFKLHEAPDNNSTYCLPSYCRSLSWVILHTSDGEALPGIYTGSSCLPSCSNCQPVICASGCVLAPRLTDAGVQMTWDGSYGTAGTCGSGSACIGNACAPEGNYIATMCMYLDLTGDAGVPCSTVDPTPTCVQVPFTWPPPAGGLELVGTLDAIDGGN